MDELKRCWVLGDGCQKSEVRSMYLEKMKESRFKIEKFMGYSIRSLTEVITCLHKVKEEIIYKNKIL